MYIPATLKTILCKERVEGGEEKKVWVIDGLMPLYGPITGASGD
jgi:hypothetical protein